ncbi:hypothetical protein [Ruminiclostridium cellobioparum]|uniref:Immunity protein 63 domain-containing protein n=1 Tax=Ruminiclostridium cellobioparum subsp. termitidis CT1112 TaxID=1195236 RepID=S0FNY4_RUMCE|nr:hypothetical protein [Ruminiclostridium cellobioparum]EMS72086.1 hypothetical protein CTER_2045 [Ruminiclostridium cellobioparum subsp. termitidis CT1112]
MKDDLIEQIAVKARKVIERIPFSKEEDIKISTFIYSDPITTYETRTDGYYKIVNERGNVREVRIAQSSDEMVDYFVEQAIWDYAFRYELNHRHKFESNLRQTHEVMEKCYQYINPARKFVKQSYDDKIHIYLDLFEEYRRIVQEYKKKYPEKCIGRALDDIDYIIQKKYTDTPGGGMNNVPKSMNLVRERILRLMQYDLWLKNVLYAYEKYYSLLKRQEIRNV